MLRFIFGWLTSGPLDRILSTVDRKMDAGTQRERIKSELAAEYLKAQASVLTGRGWWFPVLFLVPAGFWFGAVCVYSVLWCRDCAFPQAWTVAALPPPLDEWMGAIVASLFIGKAGETLMSRLRK